LKQIGRYLAESAQKATNQYFEPQPGEAIILDTSGSRGAIGSRSGRLLLTSDRLIFKPLKKKPIAIPPLKNTFLALEEIDSVALKPPPRLLPWVKSFVVRGRTKKDLMFRTSDPERWVKELNAALEKRRGQASV
jgi:hypothetical protein